jgi:flagellar motor switch protein FliM
MNAEEKLPERELAPTPAPAASDTVSQSEIEQLLAQVEGANPSLVAPLATAAREATAGENFRRHVFPKVSSFSPAELRPLRMRHEDFVAALAARLSIHLGLDVNIQLSKLEPMPFAAFAEGLGSPTFLTMLKLLPLSGIGLLDMPPRLAFAIVDRELGGPGRAPDETSQIGKMESRLLSPIISVIASEWCGTWKDLLEIRSSLLGHENNSRYLTVCRPDTSLLVVGLQTTIGETVEQMHLAFPDPMLEPLTRKLVAGTVTGEKAELADKAVPTRWNALFDGIQIEVKAHLPEIEVSVSEAANLKVGDVIKFPPEFLNQIRVILAGHPEFVGSLGVNGRNRAVKIAQRVKGT